jgi:hypothetical protein
MLANLNPLEIITYRAALALHFINAVTRQRVADGLLIRAYAFDPADPRPPHRYDKAEKSPNSGIYGFRTLPGLERYQIGDPLPAESFSFIVTVVDQLGRFLPQTLRYDLPLPNPAVQLVPLFPGPNSPTPTGYAAVRVQLLRTTAPTPPEVTVLGPSAWARVAVTVPGNNNGDPDILYHGLADGRGTALIQFPYPMIAADVLLNEAEWTVTVGVEHETAALETDYELLDQLLPDLNEEETPPFQETLDNQSAAALFETVAIVDAATQVYNVVGPTNVTELDFDLHFGRPLTLRTQVDGAPTAPLSELLLESA